MDNEPLRLSIIERNRPICELSGAVSAQAVVVVVLGIVVSVVEGGLEGRHVVGRGKVPSVHPARPMVTQT